MAQPGVVISQPGQQEKMGMVMQDYPGVAPIQGIPPGLEYLAQLDRVKVHQVFHAVEVLLGWEKNNQYQLCNEQDQQFLHAKEETDCCTRQCLGTLRPFEINLTNMQGQVVMQLSRGLNCQGCCFPCCLQEMDIFCPPGNKIATVKEVWTCWTPRFEVYDINAQLLFKIEGECCYCKCCADVPFKVIRSDGQEVGAVTKHWGGMREMCGQVNDFSVTFDRNENIMNKVILLGATFLIDFMHFEVNKN